MDLVFRWYLSHSDLRILSLFFRMDFYFSLSLYICMISCFLNPDLETFNKSLNSFGECKDIFARLL